MPVFELVTSFRGRFPVALALAALMLMPACRRPAPSAAAPQQQKVITGEIVVPLRFSSFHISNVSEPARLLRGFTRKGDWAWAAPSIAASLDVPPGNAQVYVEMDFSYPREVAGAHPTVNLTSRVNGVEVCRKPFGMGRHVFSCEVPRTALTRSPAEVEIVADQSATVDGAPQAFIIAAMGLLELEETAAYGEEQVKKAHEAYEHLLQETRQKIPPAKAREMTKMYFDLKAWGNMWFQDIKILKNPLDLWMVQQIIWEVQPDYIVETGTFEGGSALYYAHTLHGFGMEKSRILTVDIMDAAKAASRKPLWSRYVEFFLGSSVDPKIVSQIAERVKGKKVLVVLDSDHSFAHVLKEIKAYSPMVSPGSYIIVEDTHLDGVPTNEGQGPGPMAAVRQFLAAGGSRDFVQDFTRETLLMSFNPGGWLKRK